MNIRLVPPGRLSKQNRHGIAQPIAEDFRAHAATRADEWIVRRNPILTAGPIGAQRIDAQDFSEKIREVLGVAECIGSARMLPAGVAGVVVVRTPAIARGNVEQAVRSELELPAVVIELRLVEAQQDALGRGIDDVRISAEMRNSAMVLRQSTGFSGVPGAFGETAL